MRLSGLLLAALMVTGLSAQVSFAGTRGQAKEFKRACKEENPSATAKEIKSCVKGKAKAARAK